MPTIRTPQTIAAEARANLDQANTLFVPVNVVRAAELAVEFMESVSQTLTDAGIHPEEPKAEQPGA